MYTVCLKIRKISLQRMTEETDRRKKTRMEKKQVVLSVFMDKYIKTIVYSALETVRREYKMEKIIVQNIFFIPTDYQV